MNNSKDRELRRNFRLRRDLEQNRAQLFDDSHSTQDLLNNSTVSAAPNDEVVSNAASMPADRWWEYNVPKRYTKINNDGNDLYRYIWLNVNVKLLNSFSSIAQLELKQAGWHRQIRAKMMHFMAESSRTKWMRALFGTSEKIKAYTDSGTKDRRAGSELELYAAAKLFKKTIVLYRPSQVPAVIIYPPDFDGKICMSRWLNEPLDREECFELRVTKNHYEPAEVMDWKPPFTGKKLLARKNLHFCPLLVVGIIKNLRQCFEVWSLLFDCYISIVFHWPVATNSV